MEKNNFKFKYAVEGYPFDLEVIGIDNISDMVLLKSTKDNGFEEYIVASHAEINTITNKVRWANGSYFTTLEDAQKYFYSRQNVKNTLDDFSNEEIVKYLFKQEYECLDHLYTDKEIDLAYSFYMNNDNYSTFFDQDLLDNAQKYIENQRENVPVKLTYIGRDSWDRHTFEVNETKTYVKDISMAENSDNFDLHWSSPKNDMNGEPNHPYEICNEIEWIGFTSISNEEHFNYMLLGRMEADCKYYLGSGNKNSNRLYSLNEREQIDKMKEIYNSFADDRKPEWITMEQIEKYEKEMCNEEIEMEQSMNM